MKLTKFIEKIEDNKILIISNWINNETIINIFKNYSIDKEYFMKEFAFDILVNYMDIVKGKEKIGDCPSLNHLIEFLKFNDIKASELFLLCSGFRNTLINFMYEVNCQNKELEKNITYIYEQNFSGVLSSFLNKEREEGSKQLLILADKNIIMSSTNIKGIITSTSQAFCKISGYTKEELFRQSHSIVRHLDTASFNFEEISKNIQNGQTWKGELKIFNKDGGYYWVDTIIESHYDSKGNIVGYDILQQDITSKKEMEEQQAINIEQSKLAAIGEMIPMIAHQWRQPLQMVSVLVQKIPLTKIIEEELSNEFIDKVVKDISLQLNYMSKTIDDFSDFFNPEKEKQKIKCSELTLRINEFFKYMYKIDEITFKSIIIKDANLNIHINKIMQVLINIIKNARDALLEKKIQDRKIFITHNFNEKYAIIEIEDNAGGISEKNITRIFDPYFSTKKNKKGTGLGLYMCKKIIEQYCFGKISVKNKNDGVIFKIELPLN